MPNRYSFGEIHLDVNPNRERDQSQPLSDVPFRVAVLGDFTGRGSCRRVEIGEGIANRRTTLIDRDNFESVFAKMSPQLEFKVGGSEGIPITLRFTDMEDFHPDNLFQQVQLFQKLRETRERLSDPVDFRHHGDRTWHARNGARAGGAGRMPGGRQRQSATGDLREPPGPNAGGNGEKSGAAGACPYLRPLDVVSPRNRYPTPCAPGRHSAGRSAQGARPRYQRADERPSSPARIPGT